MVAIIGPQSSAIAHILAEIANGLKIPLVSYAATDSTLSSLQFPFFLRTTHSDAVQMNAIADIIEFHGWKEVIAVFVDTEFGRNAVSALEDELERKYASRVSFKLALPFQFNETQISDLLLSSKSLGPRVYVVHVDPDPAMRVFAAAEKLGMMTRGYVWFATDWLSSTVDSLSPSETLAMAGILRGVVTLRQHFPDSHRKRDFMLRWLKTGQELNAYGLYAYDTVWTVAYAIDALIREHGNLSFASIPSNLRLGKLKVFAGGSVLLEKLRETNFSGVSGNVEFDEARNVIGHGYDVINIVGGAEKKKIGRVVGFWSNDSGLSVSPPEVLRAKNYTFSVLEQRLGDVVWPGGGTERPRGWVIAVDEKPLRIVVPKRTSFVEFVTENRESHEVRGYCVDIFVEASKLVPYDIPFELVAFGDGKSNPKYDQLVKLVSNEVILANSPRSPNFYERYY